MSITLINKAIALSNPLGDILKGVLIMIIDGRSYPHKDMYTTLISYDQPIYLSVDL